MTGHKTRHGNRRVDSAAALEILAYIERNPGVVSRDLQRMLGLSRPTVSRIMQDIHKQYASPLHGTRRSGSTGSTTGACSIGSECWTGSGQYKHL